MSFLHSKAAHRKALLSNCSLVSVVKNDPPPPAICSYYCLYLCRPNVIVLIPAHLSIPLREGEASALFHGNMLQGNNAWSNFHLLAFRRKKCFRLRRILHPFPSSHCSLRSINVIVNLQKSMGNLYCDSGLSSSFGKCQIIQKNVREPPQLPGPASPAMWQLQEALISHGCYEHLALCENVQETI